MIFRFENEIVDLLLCPTAKDNFRTLKLQEFLYTIRHEVKIEQIQDCMQIMLQAHDELEKFKEWKLRGVEKDNCWLKDNSFKSSFLSFCNRIYWYIYRAL